MAPLRPLNPKTRTIRTTKEVARHVLHRVGYRRSASYLDPELLGERFEKIYDQDVWRRGNESNPGSGAGSSAFVTAALVRDLPPLLDHLGCVTLLDVGCGDFTWMKDVELRQTYHGVDVVSQVIAANREAYARDDRRFSLLDATQDQLPAGEAILCREVLFHLSFDDIRNVLRNAFSTDRKFLIATTDRITMFNSDITTGDYRPLDLVRRPFRLEEPEHEIDDGALIGGRRLGVWSAEQVRRATSRW